MSLLQPKKMTSLVIGTTAFVILSLTFVFWLSSRHSAERPAIVVPDPSYTEPDDQPTLALLNHPEDYLVFDLSAENVGEVLRSLKTPDAYSLTLISSVLAGSSRLDTDVSLSYDGRATRISTKDPQYSAEYLISGDAVFCWTPGETAYRRFAVGLLDESFIAKMPSAAALSELSPSRITKAEFCLLDQQWTILVEYATSRGLRERSYVSIDSGLVVKNEAYHQDELVLDMYVTSQSFESPETALFLLPDGTAPQ